MPVSIDRAKALVSEFSQSYPSAAELRFVLVEGTLGEAYGIEDRTHPAHTARAAYWARSAGGEERGEIHLSLANAIDDADLRRSIRHEVLGHHATNTLERAEKRAALDALIASRADPDLAQVWAHVERDYPGASVDLKAEEVFSYMAEFVEPGGHLEPLRASAMLGRMREQPGTKLTGDEAFELVRAVAAGMQTGERRQQIFPVKRESLFKQQGEMSMATSSSGAGPTTGSPASADASAQSDTSAQKIEVEVLGQRGESLAEFDAQGKPKAPRAVFSGRKSADADDSVLNRTPEDENANSPTPSRSALPAYIDQQFYRVARKFYSSNSNEAHYFEDRGDRIVANRQQPAERTAQIAIDIAKARDWKAVEVTGTKSFRREAWMRASVAGISVTGYEPTEKDRAELAHKLDRVQSTEQPSQAQPQDAVADATDRQTAKQPQVAEDATDAGQGRQPGETNRQSSARAAERAAAAAEVFTLTTAKSPQGERQVFDKAEDALRAFLTTDANQAPHLVVSQGDGARTIGQTTVADGRRMHTVAADFKDLERAIRSDGQEAGIEAAQMSAIKRQEAAHNVRVQIEETDRANKAAAELFRSEKIKASAATKEHPELAGPYAVLGAYNATLKAQGLDAEARKVALGHMRATLAQRIERGQFDSIKTQQVRFPQRDAQERATHSREQTSTETLSVA